MDLLYKIFCRLEPRKGETIISCFNEQISKGEVEVEVQWVIHQQHLFQSWKCLLKKEWMSKRIRLTIGMYYVEGMPERAYHTAIRAEQEISGVRASVKSELRKVFKYHGKVYCFYKDELFCNDRFSESMCYKT